MKTKFVDFFYSGIGAVLFVLMSNNRIVFSSVGSRNATRENNCVIVYRDRDLNTKNNIDELQSVWTAAGKKYEYCKLILDRCKYPNGTTQLSEEIIPYENPQLMSLKLTNSVIDLSELSPKALKSLQQLTLKNTTTISLRLTAFRHLLRLRKLRIKKYNNIQWVERGLLQNLTLYHLQIHGIDLKQSKTMEFFRNLTGGYTIPTIRTLNWSHNNIGTVSKDLLEGFPNLKVLILRNSCIFNFDVDTFANLKIEIAYFDRNHIRKVSEETFEPLLESASIVSLKGNYLTCNCEMKWLQSLVKKERKFVKYFRGVTCNWPEGGRFLEVEMCSKKPEKNDKVQRVVTCTSDENTKLMTDYNFMLNSTSNSFEVANSELKKFTITQDEIGFVEIKISDKIRIDDVFLLYGSYGNSSPRFDCLKILQASFNITVTPEVNYLICLVTAHQYFTVDILDCLPLRTKPEYDNQILLSRKSIPWLIISVFLVFLFAMVMGALILYLSVRKNPTLIRGSKRVIEVKKYDKAQILIMPRDYDNACQNDHQPLMGPNEPLVPPRASLSCDTISTVSYVSVIQPTQMEILAYRLNRLRELFTRENNLPSHVSSIPMQIASSTNHRLPPNVDLLLEYEWYTIRTTIMTQLQNWEMQPTDATHRTITNNLNDEEYTIENHDSPLPKTAIVPLSHDVDEFVILKRKQS